MVSASLVRVRANDRGAGQRLFESASPAHDRHLACHDCYEQNVSVSGRFTYAHPG
jgi:hypothetical protein